MAIYKPGKVYNALKKEPLPIIGKQKQKYAYAYVLLFVWVTNMHEHGRLSQ